MNFSLARKPLASDPGHRGVGEAASEPVSKRHLPTWAPLRAPLFRALWLASLASNVGSWMHDVGAAWLMTSLTQDAQLNAMVQAAGAFPVFLLALPAGAIADIIDRRKLIIWTQSWMFATTGVLALLTLSHQTAPWLLLLFTILIASGGAMTAPAWQAIIPEIVKKRQLASAMSLGGIAFNLSRVVGPALGGLIIHFAVGRFGNLGAPGVVFGLNALSFLGVVVVLVRWKREVRVSDLPPEHIPGAIKAGLRYLRHTPDLRSILVRVCGFMLCGCALWSLLPLYARTILHLDASGYGSLLGCFGASAVVMGLMNARLQRRFTSDEIGRIAQGCSAVSMVALALIPLLGSGPLVTNLARLAMFGAGLCWVSVLLTCNVVVMRTTPDWVRSRAASMFLLAIMGSSCVGSLFWGAVARQAGISLAFACAAAGLTAGLIGLRRFAIVDPAGANLEPSMHWPDPGMSLDSEPEDGPVLVTVEYEIRRDDTAAFLKAMQAVRSSKLRDGALRWNVFQDVSAPERWIETMLVESWNEYLRQHARVTHAEREIEAIAQSFHCGAESPRINHLIAGHARRPEEDLAEPGTD